MAQQNDSRDACFIMNEAVKRTAALVGDHPLSMVCPLRPARLACEPETAAGALTELLGEVLSATGEDCFISLSAEPEGDSLIFRLSEDSGSRSAEKAAWLLAGREGPLPRSRALAERCGGSLRAEAEEGGLAYLLSLPLES